MQFHRKKYLEKITEAITNKENRLIFIVGPRDAGKTTILRNLYEDDSLTIKKYYFSFDQLIGSKQFRDTTEFINYMRIKVGIDFETESLLFLNETQYSKEIGSIISSLIENTSIKTTFIVTSITEIAVNHNHHSISIEIYPMSFFEFLESRGIHTTYLSIQNYSEILLREIQPLLDEYLIWGGYPSVVFAKTQEEKQSCLDNLLKKIYEKDAGFHFAREQLYIFSEVTNLLGFACANSYKIKQLQSQVNISNLQLQKYMTFFKQQHIFFHVPHYFSDKKKEVSHQKKLFCVDTGLISYITNNYQSKLITNAGISNFIFQELLIHKNGEDKIFTYKKINMSEIDFILERSDGEIIPINISIKNSRSIPKTLKTFIGLYGDRVKKRIQLTPTLFHEQKYENVNVYNIPWCLCKDIFSL